MSRPVGVLPCRPPRLGPIFPVNPLCVLCVSVASLSPWWDTASGQVYTRRNANGVVEATNIPDAPDFHLTYPGKGFLIHSRAYRLRRSYDGEYNHHIVDAAVLHGVDVDLVRAVIQVESDFDHLAVSSKGAQGLMQLMPSTAQRMGVSNSFDARQNIFGGVRYLRLLLDMFRGDVALAAAAYNAGENAVLRHGSVPPYKETQEYVQKIRALLSPYFSGSTSVQEAASFFAPNPLVFGQALPVRAAMVRPATKPGRRVPAPPRVYYKWKDAQGVHIGQAPPSEGVVYSMIRALD